MDISRFDYHLPSTLIAQEPAIERDASKLMVVDRARQSITHTAFAQLGEFLPPKARFFRNDVAVLKARLFGERPTGGKVECLLLQPAEDASTWWCLLKPGKKTANARTFSSPGAYEATVLEAGTNGQYKVRFETAGGESIADTAETIGNLPLPPYIERSVDDPRQIHDNERYQTVYADYNKRLAVAAPTAGLHFTDKLIGDLSAAGATFHDLTLQVGVGTFHPIQCQQVEDHSIHKEVYTISPETVRALADEDRERPRVAVGTTSVRTIEDAFENQALLKKSLAGAGVHAEASIYLYPPRTFNGVDHMITNFHLPKSTLLCLVASFLTPGRLEGIDWLQAIYAEAIERKYRFYSYGDAMLIL